jgi:hypothetical protein
MVSQLLLRYGMDRMAHITAKVGWLQEGASGCAASHGARHSAAFCCGLARAPHHATRHTANARTQAHELGLASRPLDEVRQLCCALVTAIGEMAKLAPGLQAHEKAAKEAARAAAAADAAAATAAGGTADQAAAAAAAARAASSSNLSTEYVASMRNALAAGGLAAKLPPSCRKVGARRRRGRGGLAAACVVLASSVATACCMRVTTRHDTKELTAYDCVVCGTRSR